MDKKEERIDLGWANGWDETPEVVQKCRVERHCVCHEPVKNCVTKITCYECNYIYMIDSGD